MSVYEEFPEIEENMEEILKRFDTGVQKVTIKKNKELDDKGNKSERAGITTKHVIDGKLVDMDFIYDSAGTRQNVCHSWQFIKNQKRRRTCGN